MKTFRRMFATMVVVAFIVIAPLSRAQVLSQVPEQALVVVKITNLKGFSTKFGKLATDLQLAAQVPEMADPLKAFQEKANLQKGVDTAGDAAFAYLDPSLAGGAEDKSMVILFPVSDYKAFLSNFAQAPEEGGIATVKFPGSEEDAFVANWGKYAAISPTKEIAALKPTGVKLAGASAKEFGSKDIVVLANFGQLKGKLQPQLQAGKEELLGNITRDMTGDQAKYAPIATAVVNQLVAIADSFLRDVQAATFAINLTDNGISSTLMAEFEPSSYIGSFASKLKNSDKSLTVGLPAGKYLFYGGSVNDPSTIGKIIDDIVNPITAELTKQGGPEAASVNKYIAAIRQYVNVSTGQAAGWIAPTGALGQEPIFQIVSVQSGDPAAMKKAYQDMMSTQQEMMTAFGVPADAVKVTNTPNAKTIEGVSFDLTHTDMNLGQGANAAQADNTLKMIYGPEGMNAVTGQVGDKLLMGMGASDATLTAAIQAIKANDDPVGKLAGVTSVNAQLPKSRVLSLYIPLDEIVTTAGTYAGAMGMPIQIQLPPDLAPIGITAATEGSAIRIDSYTSSDLIKALVAQGMQLYMQRMGAGAPGGPGGL